jgi:histidinol phosphatase-like PHP family hydrolase
MRGADMIDLHTHTLFSDGELVPSELVRRAEVNGYTAIALTDHADISNLDFIIPRIREVCAKINEKKGLTAVPGIELTHVHPDDIPELARQARSIGARIIVVHGETIVEPVMPGTNRKALESDIDILAHPGLISNEDVEFAERRGICLEISARKGHCLSNGHVAIKALKYGARLILNTDTHAPGDLITLEKAKLIAQGAGLSEADFSRMLDTSKKLLKKAMGG